MEAEKYRNASAKEIKPLAKFILQNFIQVNTQYNLYSQTPLLYVLLSNVIKIGISYLHNVREEDI